MQNDLNKLGDQSEDTYDKLSQIIFDDLLNEIVLGLCFQMHRSSKLGFLFIDESNIDDEKKYAIVNEKGCDVFGYNTNQIKRQCECICPTCQRPISAQRFAPHLEKCMGMGRNSSRIAIKRIASVAGGKFDDSDEEITHQRKAKKKKINNSKRNNGSNNNFNNGLTI